MKRPRTAQTLPARVSLERRTTRDLLRLASEGLTIARRELLKAERLVNDALSDQPATEELLRLITDASDAARQKREAKGRAK